MHLVQWCLSIADEGGMMVLHKLLPGRYDVIVSKMVTTQVGFEEITWS